MKRLPITRGRGIAWTLATSLAGFAVGLPVVLAQSSSGEVPRLADRHPDLSGIWDNGSGIDFVQPRQEGASICVSGCGPAAGASPAGAPRAGPPPAPDRPTYREEFRARVAALDASQVRDDPVLRCFPPGVPRIGPPDKIVQRVGEVVFLYDDVSGNFFRVVPTDGRPHAENGEPSYLGHSIGRWEGDTLVVETIDFNAETWLTDDGSFHSDNLRVVERLSRAADTLTWQATAYDPDVLAEPWELRPRTATLTDVEIAEAPPCIERDLDHMVDDSSHDNPR